MASSASNVSSRARSAAAGAPAYATLPRARRAALRAWYTRHRRTVLGIGAPLPGTLLWVPQIAEPDPGDPGSP